MLYFLIGCSSEIKYTKADSLYFDSVTRADSIRNEIKNQGQRTNDSISNRYATNNIQFEISKAEFNKQSKAFLGKLKNTYDGKYYIGSYSFISLTPKFYKNRLYYLVFSGGPINYEYYDSKTKDQYIELGRVLIEKYGQPKEDTGLPKWHLTSSNHWYRTTFWKEADKVVEIRLNNQGMFNTIDLVIYREDIRSKIEQEETEKKESLAKDAKSVL